MKLIDPSDDALNEAFAVTVAGWKYWQSKHGHFIVTDPEGNRSEPAFGWPAFDQVTGEKFERHWSDGVDLPYYTTSADAVLPWLEKHEEGFGIDYDNQGHWYYVTLCMTAADAFNGEADTFPRACVIALLRSKGVEIEFTK